MISLVFTFYTRYYLGLHSNGTNGEERGVSVKSPLIEKCSKTETIEPQDNNDNTDNNDKHTLRQNLESEPHAEHKKENHSFTLSDRTTDMILV